MRAEKRRRAVWVAVGLLVAWLGWRCRPAGHPVIALHGRSSFAVVTLADRDGRLAASVPVPYDCGHPHQTAFSPSRDSIYVCGDDGVSEWSCGKWSRLAPWTSRTGTDGATVWSFALSERGDVVYGVGSYFPDETVHWFLRRASEAAPGRALALGHEDNLESWLPGGDRLLGECRNGPTVFRVTARSDIRPVAALPRGVERAGKGGPGGAIVLVQGTPDGEAAASWSGNAAEQPRTLLVRRGAIITIGPRSPDGRFVACVTNPQPTFGPDMLPLRQTEPSYIEIVDLAAGRLSLCWRVGGGVGTVVWPTQNELFFESRERSFARDKNLRWGPEHDIVRLTLKPLRARIVRRTQQTLVGTEGLPLPPVPRGER